MAHILVVDDEEMIRMAIRQVLRREGHTIYEAIDGEDGLAKFIATPTDMVITDILMPNRQGIETIAELRGVRPDVIIIAMSGGGRLNRAYPVNADPHYM